MASPTCAWNRIAVHRPRPISALIAALERGGHTDDPLYGTVLGNLGNLFLVREDYRQADAWLLRSKTWFDAHPNAPANDRANLLSNLAHAVHGLEDLLRADALYAQAMRAMQALYPDGNPDMAVLLNNRALLNEDRGDYPAALALHRQSLAMRRKVFSREHPMTLTALANVARVSLQVGEAKQAAAGRGCGEARRPGLCRCAERPARLDLRHPGRNTPGQRRCCRGSRGDAARRHPAGQARRAGAERRRLSAKSARPFVRRGGDQCWLRGARVTSDFSPRPIRLSNEGLSPAGSATGAAPAAGLSWVAACCGSCAFAASPFSRRLPPRRRRRLRATFALGRCRNGRGGRNRSNRRHFALHPRLARWTRSALATFARSPNANRCVRHDPRNARHCGHHRAWRPRRRAPRAPRGRSRRCSRHPRPAVRRLRAACAATRSAIPG